MVTACARNLSAWSELMRVFCNTKSFLLKERALVIDDAREFWVSSPRVVNERFSSLTGLGGPVFPVSANLLISSSDVSGSGGGEGVGSGCSGDIPLKSC